MKLKLYYIKNDKECAVVYAKSKQEAIDKCYTRLGRNAIATCVSSVSEISPTKAKTRSKRGVKRNAMV